MQPPRMLSTVVVTAACVSLAACTGGESTKPTAGPTRSRLGAACAQLASVAWGRPVRTRVVTHAELVIIGEQGVEVLPIAGLVPITPAVVAADGPAPDASTLARAARDVEPLEATAGPAAEPASTFDVTGRQPGRYVLFTGADVVQLRYRATCGQPASPTPMRGTFSSWFDRAVGVLQCSTTPPAGSTAALVTKFCTL